MRTLISRFSGRLPSWKVKLLLNSGSVPAARVRVRVTVTGIVMVIGIVVGFEFCMFVASWRHALRSE